MTDRQFQYLIDKTQRARDKADAFLKEAEDEYIKRIGAHPSDIDDDGWIDCMHINTDNYDVKKGMVDAKMYKNR